MQAWIGLGSNQGDSQRHLVHAVELLEQQPGIYLLKRSHLYLTAPWGQPDQPDFLNAVVLIDTELAPLALLDVLQSIEQQCGRVRGDQRWGPRTLDLDLLMYDDEQMNNPRLALPHPRLHQRAFVLAPMLDIREDLEIPGLGSACDLLNDLADQQVTMLDETATPEWRAGV